MTAAGAKPLRSRLPYAALMAAAVSVAFLGLWRTTFWGPFEPRVLEIAREQYVHGGLLRVPTFSGMPFLEKPALYYDLLALSFHAAGGPSVTAARLVHGALLIVWMLATAFAVKRVAGPRAGLLAACLVASSNMFVKLAGRISIDVALTASLTLALLFFARATSSGRGGIRRGPWILGLACGGLAFWSKGFLGTFLFGAPLLAYAAWARDRRIVRALLWPSSIAVLVLPIALWAAVLYADGGETFVFEAFVNNTLGRFLNHRFMVAGVETLEYGDVNSPSETLHYLRRIGSLAGASVVLLPFVLLALRRVRVRKRGSRTRLAALAVCFALVPPIVLTFSSQKGVHHLGSCTSGFAIAGALWLHRHAVRRDRCDLRPWTSRATATLAWLAPVLLALTLFGLPATLTQSYVIGVAVGLAGIALSLVVLRAGSRRLAAHCVLATLMLAALLSRSPGGSDPADVRFTAFPNWVRAEIGARPIGIFGHGETDLGVFAWAMESEHDSLRDVEEVARHMDADGPRFCIVRGENHRRDVEALDPTYRTLAIGGNGSRTYALVANAAAARAHRPSGRPPPQ